MLQSGVFQMKFLYETAMHISPAGKQCIEAGQYAEAVVKTLLTSKDQQFVGEMWKEANLNWKMFLPSSDIDTFIHKHVSIMVT